MNGYKIDVSLATVMVCYWVQLQRKIGVWSSRWSWSSQCNNQGRH